MIFLKFKYYLFSHIIHNGEIIKTGTPQEITQDKNVKQVYLGSKFKL